MQNPANWRGFCLKAQSGETEVEVNVIADRDKNAGEIEFVAEFPPQCSRYDCKCDNPVARVFLDPKCS